MLYPLIYRGLASTAIPRVSGFDLTTEISEPFPFQNPVNVNRGRYGRRGPRTYLVSESVKMT